MNVTQRRICSRRLVGTEHPFDENRKLKLIDFDWAGQYAKDTDVSPISNDCFVCYPLGMSSDIRWSQGVSDLELIIPQHDIEMLDRFCPQ